MFTAFTKHQFTVLYLVDVNGSDEQGEVLLGKARYVGDPGGYFKGTQDDHEDADPDTDPASQRQVIESVISVSESHYILQEANTDER